MRESELRKSNINQKIDDKREKEKKVVNKMIKIYCHGHKHVKKGVCESCQELVDYTNLKINRCPFMVTKTFCSNCKVNCYNNEMRDRIKIVMRYSGPKMLFYHPLLTFQYLILKRKEKKAKAKEIKNHD